MAPGTTIHHRHAPPSGGFEAAFAIGAVLNTAFVAAEIAFGVVANSVALLADAAHNLGDVLGLLLAWGCRVAEQARADAPADLRLRPQPRSWQP